MIETIATVYFYPKIIGVVYGITCIVRFCWQPMVPVQNIVGPTVGEVMHVPVRPQRVRADQFYPQWQGGLRENIIFEMPQNAHQTPLGEQALENTLQLFRQRLIGNQNNIPMITHVVPEYVSWQRVDELSSYFLLREGVIQPQHLADCTVSLQLLDDWLDLRAIWGQMIPNLANVPYYSTLPEGLADAQLVQMEDDIGELDMWASELLSVTNVARIPNIIQDEIGEAILRKYFQNIRQTSTARLYLCAQVVHWMAFFILFSWFVFTILPPIIFAAYNNSQTCSSHEEL